jgi:hypothetical protein
MAVKVEHQRFQVLLRSMDQAAAVGLGVQREPAAQMLAMAQLLAQVAQVQPTLAAVVAVDEVALNRSAALAVQA